MRGSPVAGAVLLLLTVQASPLRSGLVLNEVLYDPPGSDGDAEFVELVATAASTLDGVELWFLNGNDPDPPRVVWSARPGIELVEGQFWVVGEGDVLERDDSARLDLQNGPDALWLVRDGEPIDRLAWGDVPALGEGSPAEDVSGRSLGRVPDGADGDDNATDWTGLDTPSPGRRNRPPVEFGLADGLLDPPWVPHASQVLLRAAIVARGHAPQQGGEWMCCAHTSWRPFSLARQETLRLREPVRLEGARGVVGLRVRASADTAQGAWRFAFATGPGPVVLSEIMPRPASGEPEWVELASRQEGPLSLEGWAIRDLGGQVRILGADVVLPARGYLVLTGDPPSLLASHPSLADSVVHRPAGGWPTLNDSSTGTEEPADGVDLLDPTGVVVDRVTYVSDQIRIRGRSLERGPVSARTPSLWLPSPEGSSPGRANLSESGALPTSGLLVGPNPFTPDGDGSDDVLLVRLEGTHDLGEPVAEIRDLAGDRVATLTGAGTGSFHQWTWDGADSAGRQVPLGAYVVSVSARGPDAGRQRWRALVAVGRR